MRLPRLPSFIGKRKTHPEVFLSLLLYPDAVEAAIWELGSNGKPIVLGAVTQDLTNDSWSERRTAADKCITTLEDIAQTTNIQKVILGFPSPYLTKDGDIIKEIRPNIKKLTHELGLIAIGFVSIYQAIVHKYKKQEGIPPSLILLGFTAGSISVSLYRVGNFSGQITIPKEGSIAEHLEDAFAQFPSTTVLPSRIVLYGTKFAVLEHAKRDLLKHHWTARANFIHFPKIETLPGDGAAVAVSFAGSGELTNTIDDAETMEVDLGDEMPIEEENIRLDEVEEVEEKINNEQTVESIENQNEESDEEEIGFEESENTENYSNVVSVDPETLGFRSIEEESIRGEIKKSPHIRKKIAVPTIIKAIRNRLNFSINKTNHSFKLLLVIPIFLLIFAGYYIVDTILPNATVTITTIPQTVTTSMLLTIDPELTEVSGTVIPGRKKEQSETGEKTVSVTGKKTLGEAAKGTVTVLNKTTVPKTYKKGTTISTGGIDFTLDRDISIASATETFQGITYTKENVTVTAKQIGTKGNIQAGRDFVISNVSSTVASARNDQSFTGGTSKDVIVVARGDQELIVKDLTQELTKKAKERFEVEGQELLLSETIKTSVTEKVFSAEIGEEASQLDGKITVTISGIGYRYSDITTVLKEKVKDNVSQGYMLSSDLPSIETGSPKIAKDGTITLSATVSAIAIPNIDLPTIAQQIVGKDSKLAEETIKSYQGIQNVQFSISSLFNKERLPKKLNKISLVVSSGQ